MRSGLGGLEDIGRSNMHPAGDTGSVAELLGSLLAVGCIAW